MPSISNRTNTLLLVLILATGIAIVAMLATGARGGPLDPPAAPAPMDGVHGPGTPISSAPFLIFAPGHYFLTRNLSVTNLTAVSINASDVDLDLAGFEINVGGATSFGIRIEDPSVARIKIHGGSIVSAGVGIFAKEAGPSAASDVTVEDIRINSASTGIDLTLSGRSIVRRCSVTVTSAADGIAVGSGSIVDGCTVTGGGDAIQGDDNVVIQNCTVNGASSSGINVVRGEISHCAVNGANVGITLQHGTASNVTVADTLSYGIQLNGGAHAVDCSVSTAGSHGIFGSALTSVDRCVVDGARSTGIIVGAGGTVGDSIVRNSGLAGIIVGVGGKADGNTVAGSGAATPASGDGIVAGAGASIANNVVTGNANNGILASSSGALISGNTVTNNTAAGIIGPVGGNTYTGNSARGNTPNLSATATNVTGVLITAGNDTTNTIPQTNFTP